MLVRPFVLFTLLLLVLAAPVPARSAEPGGFNGRGGATITLTAPNGLPLRFTIEVGLAQRDNLFRFDLLSVTAPQGGEALAAALPANISLVFDRTTQKATVWSAKTRMYALAGPGAMLTVPSPAPSPSASPSFAFKGLKALTISTTFAGHGTANGHPTTNFKTAFHWQYESKAPVDFTLTAALAEDLNGMPVQLRADGKNMSAVANITSITRSAPDAAQFTVPAGYALAQSVPEALGIRFPTAAPSATPSPLPKA